MCLCLYISTMCLSQILTLSLHDALPIWQAMDIGVRDVWNLGWTRGNVACELHFGVVSRNWRTLPFHRPRGSAAGWYDVWIYPWQLYAHGTRCTDTDTAFDNRDQQRA